MSLVRLGKIHLHWCDHCNVPIVEEGDCALCGEPSRKVEITPPGDVRPAFDEDILIIRDTIDRQWGDDYSYQLLSDGTPVVLNGIPSRDKMDEVIVDGEVIGALRYNPERKLEGKDPYEFILRPWEGLKKPDEGFVEVDQGAVEPILDGGSVLAPGITAADPSIEEGGEVIVTDESGDIICSGPARYPGKELVEASSGRGVKNRWRISDYSPNETKASWDDVIKANREHIDERVNDAVEFVEKNVEKNELPVAVAYSGGKYSLATLHILLEAGIDPDLIFIDTGIELPETIENVRNVAKKYDLTLHERKADSGYWDNLDHFGPSARDYRWCCKTCKLGPTALLIDETYQNGVLSFIGQRRYESRQRMSQGSTWDNPWVPGQKSASPIQDWTALHVWLYLFQKNAEWNPWYEKGFERIGCWVCPASDLAEFEKLKEEFSDYQRFEKALKKYAEKNDLQEEWIELGLWRWLDVPENMEKLLDGEPENIEKSWDEKSIDEMLKHRRTKNLLNALCDVEESSFKELDKEEVLRVHKKALHCVECGVCVGRCEKNALSFDNGVKIDPEKCDHCGRCLGKCPVVHFDART
ncbi:MAG: phosphoadenosine phosphosulfate reductase family protein [Candidatus Thermoplasmatota archaeon]